MQTNRRHRNFQRAAALWSAAAAIYFLWEALSYRGLFARLAELQIANYGAYAPLLTFAFLFGLALLPALILMWVFKPADPAEDDGLALAALRVSQARRLRATIMIVAGISAAVAIGFATFAALVLPGQSGKLQTIAASEIGTVSVKEGPARLVGGELGTIVYFGHEWYIGDQRMAFAPYRSASGGDGVARVFVELDATDRQALKKTAQRPVWTGILVEGGLPGAARSLFGSIGVGIGAPYYTLYRNEYALKIGYWLQAIQWMILAIFLGLVAFVQTRRINRLKESEGSVLL